MSPRSWKANRHSSPPVNPPEVPDILDSASNILNATMTQRRDLTDALTIIKIRPDAGVVPPFVPGQFINVALPSTEVRRLQSARPARPRLVRRAYSIASPPSIRDHVELFLVRVEQGKLTPRLWTVEVGGRVWIDDTCSGEFTLDGVPTGKDLVMIATGTGIAPYVSMLREFCGTRRWRRFVLIHGTRLVADLGYRDELEAIGRADPTVLYLPTVTREPSKSIWPGMRGRIQHALEPTVYEKLIGRPLSPEHSEVFLCGNPAMIQETAAMLEPMGFTLHTKTHPGNLHYERYW